MTKTKTKDTLHYRSKDKVHSWCLFLLGQQDECSKCRGCDVFMACEKVFGMDAGDRFGLLRGAGSEM